MRLPRPQFRIVGFLLLILILAVILGPGLRFYRECAAPSVLKTYYVGDLIQGPAGFPEITALVKDSVPRAGWFRDRQVTPFYLSLSLIVRDTEDGHRNVAAWFRRRRDARNGRKP